MPIHAETLTKRERERVRTVVVTRSSGLWAQYRIEFVDPSTDTYMEVVGEKFEYSDDAAERARELFPYATIGVR